MSSHLVQILLPIYNRSGRPIQPEKFGAVRRTLTERFGGVTAYTRAPATGAWKTPDGAVERDDMIMVEVVVDAIDRDWWSAYRRTMEREFDQESIHARALALELL